MTLNDTPGAQRVRIALFGGTNTGKSSIFNQLVNQDIAVVSDVKGTTTDPVAKAMELLPIGAVEFVDTPGLDDVGGLGEKRVAKAREILRSTDIALIIVDAVKAKNGEMELEKALLSDITGRRLPYLIVLNKAERLETKEQGDAIRNAVTQLGGSADDMACAPAILYSTRTEGFSVEALRQTIASIYREEEGRHRLVADLVKPGDTVVLVVPIDESAPKGRLILPQQQVIREVLDIGAYALVIKDTELKAALRALTKPPALVITDSQVFEEVASVVDERIPLTSFSILQARLKGDFYAQLDGARAIDALPEGAKILIAEGCTHHRQCKDIGTVKLPGWITKHTGKQFVYEFSSGREFPDAIEAYDLILHCGGCMLHPREMRYRIQKAKDAGVPVTNYGMVIAYMHGISERATALFEK